MLAAEQEKLAKERAAARKSMVSTGDRSAKYAHIIFPKEELLITELILHLII